MSTEAQPKEESVVDGIKAQKIAGYLDAAALLIGSGNCDSTVKHAILGRAGYYLEAHWCLAYAKLKKQVPAKFLPIAVKAFWDEVARNLPPGGCHVYSFLAIYNETVNPPGKEGQVQIEIRTCYTVEVYIIKLDGLKPLT